MSVPGTTRQFRLIAKVPPEVEQKKPKAEWAPQPYTRVEDKISSPQQRHTFPSLTA